jgi:predicted phosphoribosyltransferase
MAAHIKSAKMSNEYSVFESALKQVVSVPRSELQRREAEYQQQRTAKREKTG